MIQTTNLFSFLVPLIRAEICNIGGYSKYCSAGCCYSDHEAYCCTNWTWIVVGVVLGVAFLIGVTVVTVVVCCKYSHRGTVGHVVSAAPTTQVVYTTSK